MNPPRSFKATPPYAWFSKEMLGHIERKLSEDRYVDQALAIRAHYFTLCQICSNCGGHPTFPARVSKIAELTQCSNRTSRSCLQALVEIGAIGRNRDRVGNSYIYTLLALPEYTVAGAAIIAGGAAINSPPLRHGVPQYKNKVQKKRGIGRVSVLPKSSGVPKGKAPVASHDNGNGALPRLTDAMRVSAERELDRVERAINNLEPEAHMSEKDVLSNIERLRLKQLRVRRKELKARLDLVD